MELRELMLNEIIDMNNQQPFTDTGRYGMITDLNGNKLVGKAEGIQSYQNYTKVLMDFTKLDDENLFYVYKQIVKRFFIQR